MKGDERHFDGDSLVPHVVHPTKVAIVEAMQWLRIPMSAIELKRVFDDEYGLSLVAFHMAGLAELSVLEQVGTRRVRGAVQRFYVLTPRARGC